MTSFCMTSLHVDLNEAAKCVDMPLTLLAWLSHIRALVQMQMVTTFDLTYEYWLWRKIKVRDVTIWKDVQVAFYNNFNNPKLVL